MEAKVKLYALAKAQLGPAKALIQKRNGMEPVLCFETATGICIAEIPQYGSPELKGLVLAGLRELLKDQDAERYAFTMEAWVGEKSTSDDLRGYTPSKDPKREEAIMVSAADAEGNKLVLFCKITGRDPVTFSEPEVLDITHGALLELLDATPTIN